MNSKGRPHRSWMSILSRLVLVLSFLMMMASTAVSLSNSSNNSPRRLASIMPSGQGQTQRGHDIRFGPAEPQRQAATQPQHAVKGMPGLQPFAPERSEAVQGPIDLKLLVISADGQETDFLAITTFLNQIGTPYDTLIASQQQLVPYFSRRSTDVEQTTTIEKIRLLHFHFKRQAQQSRDYGKRKLSKSPFHVSLKRFSTRSCG